MHPTELRGSVRANDDAQCAGFFVPYRIMHQLK
jgi:hypothetical protein